MKVSLNMLKKLRALSRHLKAHGFKLGDVVATQNTLTRKPWPDIGVVKEVNEYGEYNICWLDGCESAWHNDEELVSYMLPPEGDVGNDIKATRREVKHEN